MIDRKWASTGVDLTVSFMDTTDSALKNHILLHMNAWAKTANVRFRETASGGRVRIARDDSAQGGGYWSYLGTEIDEIPKDEQTMNLEGFTMNTKESEFHRVVRHETGHTLGFPHEHMRKELVAKIDREKAIKYFMRTQGWSREEVIQQVLTPLDDKKMLETATADPYSIMCYQIPGEITKDGKPIIGGTDIDASDYAFAAKLYPNPPGQVESSFQDVGSGIQSVGDAAVIEITAAATRVVLGRPGHSRSVEGISRPTSLRGESPRRQRVVAGLIQILREAGKPEPIDEDTTIGNAADVILKAINDRFFPGGGGFADGEIDPGESVGQLASEIIQRQG